MAADLGAVQRREDKVGNETQHDECRGDPKDYWHPASGFGFLLRANEIVTSASLLCLSGGEGTANAERILAGASTGNRSTCVKNAGQR